MHLSPYKYSAETDPDHRYPHKVSLVRPLSEADGSDALIGMPSHAADEDRAERRTPIHVGGLLLIDINARGYHGPTVFDCAAPLLALADFLNECVHHLEPPSWEGVWPPIRLSVQARWLLTPCTTSR